MAEFGPQSEKQLATCHPDLVKVLRHAIKFFDFSVIEGFRDQATQDRDFQKGVTKLRWPNGNHNSNPSKAADCMPYPVDWSDRPDNIRRTCYMAGIIMASARELGIKLRWGGDWNQNDDTRDEGDFRDWDHFELV